MGRTTSLARRMGHYRRAFQPHSPNDYKIRCFQEFAAARWPDAAFDLHFSECECENCRDKETHTIRRYKPLINTLEHTARLRDPLRDAYSAFYNAAFEVQRHQTPNKEEWLGFSAAIPDEGPVASGCHHRGK